MAKIGTLSYDINGQDNLKKILQEDKKLASDLQKTLRDTNAIMGKIDLTQLRQYSSIMSKSQKDAIKLASLQQKSDDESVLRQQKLRTEIERTNAAHKRYLNAGQSGQSKLSGNIGLTNKTMFSQQNLLTQLSQAAGIYFSVYQVGSFIQSLYTISGEFEKQKVSLGAILQNTDQAGVLFERIKTLAVESPFQFSELISYTKQLSAFSIPYNELYDTTKRLADISAGLGVDMSRLVLAFGQVRSASVLRGQELRQFTEAGIPLVDELAKKFTKLTGEATTAGDVFDKISRKQVSFQMVKDIFTDLTSAGGKFYNFQAIQAETLAGKLSNLKDSYQIMLATIGEGNSGVMKDSVELLTSMMRNWEDIARVLKTLIAVYGTYKAVLIVTNTLQKIAVTYKTVTTIYALSAALQGATISQVAFNAATSVNPYVAAAMGLAALVGAIVLFTKETKTAAEIQSDFYKKVADEAQALETLKSKTESLASVVTDVNKSYSERSKALRDLKELMPTVFSNLSKEQIAAMGVAGAYREIAKGIKAMGVGTARTDYYQSTKALLQAENAVEIAKNSPGQTGQFLEDAEEKLALARKLQSLTKKTYLDLATDLKMEGNAVESTNKAWRDKVDELKKIKGVTGIDYMPDDSYADYIGKIQDEYEKLIKKNKDYVETNPFAKKEIAANKEQIESYKKVLVALGGTMKKEKTPGEVKDPIYERVKQQIDVIDKAKDAYDEYLKKVSSSEASKIIKKQTGVDLSKSSAEDQLKNIDTSGMLPKNVLSTTNRIAELSIKYNKEDTVENLKIALDASLKYVNDNKKKYNIYKSLLSSTGDESLSSIVAFGDGKKMASTYLEYVKDLFKTQAGISFDDFIKLDDKDKKKSLINEYTSFLYGQINDESNSQREKDLEMYSDMLSDFAGYNDKKAAIEYKYREKIRIAEEAGNLDLAKKLRVSLSSELQKITPDYNKFFTSIYSLTKTKAVDIGDAIKKNLKDQLDKGVISANEYYESIKKINEQLDLSAKGIDYFGKMQSGGVGGLLEGLKEKSSSDYQSSLTDLESAADTYEQAMKMGDEKTQSMAAGNMNSASSSMGAAKGMQAFASKASTAISAVDQIVTAIDQSVKATQQLVDGFAELAESRGIDTNSGKWAEVKGLMSTMSAVNEKAKASWDSAKSGDIAGAVANAVGIVTSGLTAINKWHDQKYNKIIQNSVREVKKLQTAYEDLNTYLERQLGGITTNQALTNIENLKSQQAELAKQRDAENAKKDTDKDAIADYEDQIHDLGETIKYFYEDLFSSTFGSDIKDWASQISKALVDAFSNGEDAAKAFDSTVADIVNGLAGKMIQLQYIEPAMDGIRDYLFGKNGVYNDAKLDGNDFAGLVKKLSSLNTSVGEAKNAYDLISAAAKEAGIDLEKTADTSTGITANAQSLTEGTGNILASYINAIRADLSVIRSLYDGSNGGGIMNEIYSLFEGYCPTIVNILSLNNSELIKIQNNTLRSANNSDGILEAIIEVRSIFKKATTSGSGTKVNIV